MNAFQRPLVALIACAVAAPALAQSRFPVAVDQRVRIWTSAPAAITGRVVSASADGLEIAGDDRAPVRVAASAVQRIEVSRSTTSKGAGAKKGALWGALISGAIGAVLLPLQVGESGQSVAEAVAVGAWSGGLFGGLIGAGVGAARAGDKWEPVWP